MKYLYTAVIQQTSGQWATFQETRGGVKEHVEACLCKAWRVENPVWSQPQTPLWFLVAGQLCFQSVLEKFTKFISIIPSFRLPNSEVLHNNSSIPSLLGGSLRPRLSESTGADDSVFPQPRKWFELVRLGHGSGCTFGDDSIKKEIDSAWHTHLARGTGQEFVLFLHARGCILQFWCHFSSNQGV